MATNRVWTDQASGQKREATEYHSIVAWGRLGEIAGQYLKRGGLVMIEGRLQTRSWVGKDSLKRYTTEIVAESLQLGPRAANADRPVTDITPPARQNSQNTNTPNEPDIPIINEDELTKPSTEEDELKVKDDLPF